ncbi:MAG: hypothetical protein ACKVJH_07880, partial [Flavobacteriales bacterium]
LCTDESTCNYADGLNAACESLSCAGCTNPAGCNYDSTATLSATCTNAYGCDACSGETDGSGTVVDNDLDDDGVCNADEVAGCTNPLASNYAVNATDDDGSCVIPLAGEGCNYCVAYDPAGVCMDAGPVCNYGPYESTNNALCSTSCGGGESPVPFGFLPTCALPWACNYLEEGDCEFTSCVGCTVEEACNYDSNATSADNGSCTYDCYGCTNAAADNYDATSTMDDGSCVVSGCTSSGACNYDSTATSDDASCEYTSCLGCMQADACNYDAGALLNELLECTYASGCDTCSGETDGTGLVVDNDTDNDGICNDDEVPGCTDSSACNYNISATDDDSSCLALDSCGVCGGSGVDTDGDGVCDANEVEGCMVSSACNYSSAATDNVGCDFTSCEGCMDDTACTYDEDATASVPSQCLYPIDLYGAVHFDCAGVCLNDVDGDGVCDEDEVPGCMISSACNYSSSATDEDASCTYPASNYVDCDGVCLVDEDNDGVCDQEEVYGCTNDGACNFDLAAGVTEDDGSCEFSSCAGCTIESACNYDVTATLSDNASCTYIPAGWDDCDETICTDSDNDGNCDFDEVEGCLGEFVAPHIVLSGVVELDSSVADWSVVDYTMSVTDAIGVDGATTWVDYPGRLEDGRYSVTRIYSASDVCGNTSEAGQLLIADDSHASGCTNASATSYDSAAINDDGSCDYSPACLGDLNLDNIVGTSDLLILLSAFGLDCLE